MRTWEIDNLIITSDDRNLCFNVYAYNKLIGIIYATDRNNFNDCFLYFDVGVNPIKDGWEDGLGNVCTINGWGECVK